MKAKAFTLNKDGSTDIAVNADIFGCDVRPDILKRVVNWQLAKRQAGTHKTKTVSEIQGTTAKPFRQKGTGRARQGSLRSVQMRGGATSFGPVVRSHAHSLNKKIRKLGLKMALSSKAKNDSLLVLKGVEKLENVKTKDVVSGLKQRELESVLFVVDNNESDFRRAVANIAKCDTIPVEGLNVYDVLKHDALVVTEAALKLVEGRLA